MKNTICNLPFSNVRLTDSRLLEKRKANRDYMMRLNSDSMLLNYRMEAGYPRPEIESIKERYGGWEDPTSQLRGHFLGHWLSAAAMMYAATNDRELKGKADFIVDDLANCQKENGGLWAGSIPEKYLYWIGKGKKIWAPQYTVHKTLMGLLDMYRYAGNETALDIVIRWAKWFTAWSSSYTREEFDRILDVETGGMMEVWAILYSITHNEEHKRLMETYYRRKLFDPLLEGRDVLTNMHANTTVPEALGAAAAYEATGESRYLDIAIAYWKCAVDIRGQYATGSNTCGEIYAPPLSLSPRLGDRNQEHCFVYNMMRLADFLYRHTGEAKYADYWEMNLYNGIMAQGYWKGRFDHGRKAATPQTGLLTYYLGLRPGSTKAWCSETQDFFCCHGTLVQANAAHNQCIFYKMNDNAIFIAQYFSAEADLTLQNTSIRLSQKYETLSGSIHDSSDSPELQAINETTSKYPNDPRKLVLIDTITLENQLRFKLYVRIPWWCDNHFSVKVNGRPVECPIQKGHLIIDRQWQNNDQIYLEFQRRLHSWPLPDDPSMVAFLDGPVLLAGLCCEERTLTGFADRPETLITPDCEREWAEWRGSYRTFHQDHGFRLIPISQIGYEPYSIYFHIQNP